MPESELKQLEDKREQWGVSWVQRNFVRLYQLTLIKRALGIPDRESNEPTGIETDRSPSDTES